MNTVYVVEWCPCKYESAYAIESLHRTKVGAYRALRKLLLERWHHESTGWNGNHMRQYFPPLTGQLWRIRAIEIQD